MEILGFDIIKADRSGKTIHIESDKLKRLADKLKHTIENTASWWSGETRNGFIRQMDTLIATLYKTADIVMDMSNDILIAIETKKEDEAALKKEISQIDF